MHFKRHAPGDHDVTLDVKFCGVCHTDVHNAKNDFMSSTYPICPGHEVAGVVTAVGSAVSKFKVGDRVGVGCIVDACLKCRNCLAGNEQFCTAPGGFTWSYGSKPVHGRAGTEVTMGGYSTCMVVHEYFLVNLPDSLPMDKAGPLLCAGVTTYSPLRRFNVGPGTRVGINGLGGLGTMAVKQAKAMGATVTVISRSRNKESHARAMGASSLVVSTDPASLREYAGSLDLVIDTVAVRHDLGANVMSGPGLLDLLDVNGTWVYAGVILDMQDVQPVRLVFKQNAVTGSLIGGIKMTQECIDFCAKHGLLPETEVVPATPAMLTKVFELLDAGNDKGMRYVLAIGDTLNESTFKAPRARAPNLTGRTRLAAQLFFVMGRLILSKVEGAVIDRAGLIAGTLAAATVAGVGVLAASRIGPMMSGN